MKLSKSKNKYSDSAYYVDALAKISDVPFISEIERISLILESFTQIKKSDFLLYSKLEAGFFDPKKNLLFFLDALEINAFFEIKFSPSNEYHKTFLLWLANYHTLLEKAGKYDKFFILDILNPRDDSLILEGFDDVPHKLTKFFKNITISEPPTNGKYQLVEYENDIDFQMKYSQLKELLPEIITFEQNINPKLLAIHQLFSLKPSSNFPSLVLAHFKNPSINADIPDDFESKLASLGFSDFDEEVADLINFIDDGKSHIKSRQDLSFYIKFFLKSRYNLTAEYVKYPSTILLTDQEVVRNKFLPPKKSNLEKILSINTSILLVKSDNLELKHLSTGSTEIVLVPKISYTEKKIATSYEKTPNNHASKNLSVYLKYLQQCQYKAYVYQNVKFLPKKFLEQSYSTFKSKWCEILINNFWLQTPYTSSFDELQLDDFFSKQELNFYQKESKNFPQNFLAESFNDFKKISSNAIIYEVNARTEFSVSINQLISIQLSGREFSFVAPRIDTQNGYRLLVKYQTSTLPTTIPVELLAVDGLIIYDVASKKYQLITDNHLISLAGMDTSVKPNVKSDLRLDLETRLEASDYSPDASDAFTCERCFAKMLCPR